MFTFFLLVASFMPVDDLLIINTMPEKILFVVNPGSGKSKINWEQEIDTYFKDKNYIIDIYKLSKPPDCDDLKNYIDKSNAKKIVAVGGDGTVTMVAGFLSGKSIPMGLLPAGSANGMATELMIPGQPQKALAVLEEGVVTPVDTILVNNEYTCLHLSDIGVNAQLIKNFEDGNKRGIAGYAKVLLKTLMKKDRFVIDLETHDDKICRNAIMVVIANAGKYGTGATINPNGEIDDKIFEAVVVKKMTIGSVFRMLSTGNFKPKNIETFHCKSLKITSRRKVHFQVDGEYLGKVKEVNAVIQPHNINLILPKSYLNADK